VDSPPLPGARRARAMVPQQCSNRSLQSGTGRLKRRIGLVGAVAALAMLAPEAVGSSAASDGPISLFSGAKLFDCGASGSFTLAYRVHHYDCSPTDSGTWMIVGGTGVYAGMTGEGLLSGA